MNKADYMKLSEDEKIRTMLIEIVRQWKNGAQAWCDNDKVIDDTLAWLNKQSKPIEWTKLDDISLEKCLEAIHGHYNLAYKDKLKNWLNSLKNRVKSSSRWKPNEEQMEAFEHFVRSAGESGYASSYENNTKLLYSLLEQLKKIREE